MKTNMEYLKEFIEGNEEALEFWDAVAKEIKEDKAKIKRLQQRVMENVGGQTSDGGYHRIIDCGIGTIEYKTRNLKLQSIMEDLKEKLEHKAKFGVLPETVEL